MERILERNKQALLKELGEEKVAELMRENKELRDQLVMERAISGALRR